MPQRIMTKKQEIAVLQKKIDKARSLAMVQSKKMTKNGFKMEDIKEYNNRLVTLGTHQIKMKFLCKTTNPEQYMNEISVPGNINL